MSQDVYPTKHLIEKLEERNITWAEIVEIIDNPEVVYGPDPQGRRTMQKGDLCVIVGRDGGVITTLLRDAEQWDAQKARDRKKPRRQ